MIKAVVFDMGGVVVDLDMGRCIANFKEKAGFGTIEEFLDPWHQKGFISDLEEGLTTAEDFDRECLLRSRPGTSAETVRACFCSLLTGLNPRAVEIIRELRGRYPLYVLSNNNPITRAWFGELLRRDGLAGVFEKEFYSYEMKLLKPSREIYDRAVAEIGVRPEEVLFIDDSRSNADGAKAAGITTLWLQPGMDIVAEVKRIINDQ
jgi:putative hydrolase of the HAD superfamily